MRIYPLECANCNTTTRHMLTQPRIGNLGPAEVDPYSKRLRKAQELIESPTGKTKEVLARCLQCSLKRRYGLEAA